MIDIQHHPLRPFKQDGLACIMGGGQYCQLRPAKLNSSSAFHQIAGHICGIYRWLSGGLQPDLMGSQRLQPFRQQLWIAQVRQAHPRRATLSS